MFTSLYLIDSQCTISLIFQVEQGNFLQPHDSRRLQKTDTPDTGWGVFGYPVVMTRAAALVVGGGGCKESEMM
ncbi:MAG TPA: hypothetical protein DEB24_06720 [Coriobacteriia bacterium]|nr:hypothetical protein [Coriobacteriia bacterium]